jgi:hypothetical protein
VRVPSVRFHPLDETVRPAPVHLQGSRLPVIMGDDANNLTSRAPVFLTFPFFRYGKVRFFGPSFIVFDGLVDLRAVFDKEQ